MVVWTHWLGHKHLGGQVATGGNNTEIENPKSEATTNGGEMYRAIWT